MHGPKNKINLHGKQVVSYSQYELHFGVKKILLLVFRIEPLHLCHTSRSVEYILRSEGWTDFSHCVDMWNARYWNLMEQMLHKQ